MPKQAIDRRVPRLRDRDLGEILSSSMRLNSLPWGRLDAEEVGLRSPGERQIWRTEGDGPRSRTTAKGSKRPTAHIIHTFGKLRSCSVWASRLPPRSKRSQGIDQTGTVHGMTCSLGAWPTPMRSMTLCVASRTP